MKRLKRLSAICAALTILLPAAARPATTPAPGAKPAATARGAAAHKIVKTSSGLSYVDLVVGKGPMPKTGQTISVLYTGKLTNGKVFDSTSTRNNEPFETPIGVGQVIKGWDEGMLTMRVGGKRRLTIPPSLGYGAQAVGPIPPNSTLIFDVELLAVK
jgi:peptidylprolyl isomerase